MIVTYSEIIKRLMNNEIYHENLKKIIKKWKYNKV